VFGNHHSTGSQAGPAATSTSNRPSSPRQSTPGASTAPASGTTICATPAIGCTGGNATALETEPSDITVAADGATFLKNLTWSGWGTATAMGTGILEGDNCIPNCAEGSDTPYDATVTLSGLAPYGNGEQAYSVMVLSVPSAPSRSETFSSGLVP
jgi:hypothetical protein